MEQGSLKQISSGQMMRLLFIALIALCAEAVPGIMGAGSAAWIAPLLVLLPVLGIQWLAFRPWKKRGADASRSQPLAQKPSRRRGLETCLSRGAGKVLALLFLGFGLCLLVVNCARSTRRLIVADGTPVFFSAVVLILAVWMAAGSLPAFARSCEIFYLIMAVGLLGIVLLGVGDIQVNYLLLIRSEDWMGLPRVALLLLGTASVGVYGLFLSGSVSLRAGDRARVMRWTAFFFLSLTGVLILVIGTFGPALAQMLERPFFQMVAGLGVTGAFQRLEALVSALWLLGDVALVGLLLFAVRKLWQAVSGRDTAWSVILAGIVAFAGGELLAGQQGLLRLSQERLLPLGSLIVGAVAILLLFAMGMGKQKNVQKSKKAVDNPGSK